MLVMVASQLLVPARRGGRWVVGPPGWKRRQRVAQVVVFVVPVAST